MGGHCEDEQLASLGFRTTFNGHWMCSLSSVLESLQTGVIGGLSKRFDDMGRESLSTNPLVKFQMESFFFGSVNITEVCSD